MDMSDVPPEILELARLLNNVVKGQKKTDEPTGKPKKARTDKRPTVFADPAVREEPTAKKPKRDSIEMAERLAWAAARSLKLYGSIEPTGAVVEPAKGMSKGVNITHEDIVKAVAASLKVYGTLVPPPEAVMHTMLRKCPRCTEVKAVASGFGVRKERNGTVAPQIWCRACRNSAASHPTRNGLNN